MKSVLLAICLAIAFNIVDSAPQQNAERYQPYNYEYRVEDAEQKLFHDKSESSDDSGRVRDEK
jgi:hypothetical protein